MPADARGGEQPRAGKKKSSMCLVGKKTSREEGKTALLRRDGRTKFSHENLFLLKKTKARKSSISFTGKKKKGKRTEILRFCPEKESPVSLLIARQ